MIWERTAGACRREVAKRRFSYMDLVEQRLSNRLEIAGHVDEAAVAEEAENLESHQVNLEIQTQIGKRRKREGSFFACTFPPGSQAAGPPRGVNGRAFKIMSCRVYGSGFIGHGSWNDTGNVRRSDIDRRSSVIGDLACYAI